MGSQLISVKKEADPECVAMQRLEFEGTEDHELECTGKQVALGSGRHSCCVDA
jgi:hypothetical protein